MVYSSRVDDADKFVVGQRTRAIGPAWCPDQLEGLWLTTDNIFVIMLPWSTASAITAWRFRKPSWLCQ